MIWNVVRVGIRRLWHGTVDLSLTFLAPIVFFTIFALIFDGQLAPGNTPRAAVALVDEDGTDLSSALTDALAAHDMLRVHRPEDGKGNGVFHAATPARDLVLSGGLSLAVVIPRGWSASLTDHSTHVKGVQILADTADPVAPQIVSALLHQVAGQVLAERARAQGRAIDALGIPGQPRVTPMVAAAIPQPVSVEVVDLLGAEKANPIVSMYAAGIAVMFLLFNATGRGGSLLEEEENQTLERLMCSQLSMTQFLVGKWLLLTLIGLVQVTVMFIWAQLIFGVDLTGHIPGFLLMTGVTAAAASSLALVLAAACRTRTQLNAVAIILVLCMSAMGGSMVPRYVMNETMQKMGRVTFNAWALDGYTKVFWRDLPPADLWLEVTVLGTTTIVLFVVARLLARRWETV